MKWLDIFDGLHIYVRVSKMICCNSVVLVWKKGKKYTRYFHSGLIHFHTEENQSTQTN